MADHNHNAYVQVTGILFSDEEDDYEQTFYPVDDLPHLHETPFYYLSDFNKNITAVTDENGAMQEAYAYDPFGNARLLKSNSNTQQKNPFRFSSEYFDEELGLIYYNYRHYNPKDGRWLSREPLEERESANLYRFVDNNPLNTIDIKGKMKVIPYDTYRSQIIKIHKLKIAQGDSDKVKAIKAAQIKWLDENLVNGCIGITTVALGSKPRLKNCYPSKAWLFFGEIF